MLQILIWRESNQIKILNIKLLTRGAAPNFKSNIDKYKYRHYKYWWESYTNTDIINTT